ncbi:Hypothetical predicted protein [Mytilus galloprovincialis]|uniref:ATP-dependent DNA helicase n=1 Tax=Mytilus galloprovincialis TaxID=29158 RepID=A0A8B6G607_MYTGA|nr:Hypothetical predicted protein [Mytilus galloprovincialis]
MPTSIKIFNSSFVVNFGDSINAIDSEIDADFPFALPLNIGIENALIVADGCFISVNGYTSLVIKQGIRIFYFDSHSRDLQGKPCENGSSIVIELTDICHLYHILKDFVQDDPQSLFEITSVNVTICSKDKETSFTKKKQNNDKTKVAKDKDLEILESCLCSNLNYIPIGYKTKLKLCSKFKISQKNVKETADINKTFNMGKPVKSKSIISDGNCLFRAISFAISQRQEYHMQIRKKIVDHILHISKDLTSFVRHPYENVEEYVNKRKMKESNTWGTELEILAAAHLMQADIYTFINNKWIRYSAHQIDKHIDVENDAIYLKHVEESFHYEVVISVEESRENHLLKKSKYSKGINENFDKLQRNMSADHVNSNTCPIEIVEIVDHTEMTDLTKKRRRGVEVNVSNDNVKYDRETNIDANQVVEDTDLEMLDPTVFSGLNFVPIGYKTKRKLCSKFKISHKNTKETSGVYATLNMGKPVKSKSIISDGNSLFRALSFSISQRQEYHMQIRNKVVDHILNISNDLSSFVRDPYQSAEEYARKQKLREPKTDGAELEILAAAHFMQVDIYTFTDNKWIKYSAHQIDEDIDIDKEAIYLQYNIIEKVKEKRSLFKVAKSHIDVVVQTFKDAIKKGPEYVWACCLRLLFQNQVLECRCENYDQQLIQKCVTEKYVHKCSRECKSNCLLAVSSRNKLWICYTCHRKLHRGLTPPESFCNNLQLETVPDELCNLNKLESHLVALNIPFQKIMNLPRGNQAGIIGPVVLVPSDVKVVTNTLPRPVDDNLLVKVKLKRKLEYKGYVQYEFVDIKHVEKAFNYLRKHNKWYANIELNSQWMETNNEQNQSTDVVNDSANDSNKVSDKNNDTNAEESYLNESLRGIQLDTCLQPADIGQEVLDCYFDEEFDVAPAEGNNPIRVLKEEGIESKTFPCHYPSGKNTLTDQRDLKLSASRYFNLRLLSVENRFARDTSYIFFCQYLSELEKVMSNVQISLRKDFSKTGTGKKVTSDMICRGEGLKQLFKSDEGIKFLKPIRGTPPFWQKTQKDVLAMIRQIGIPAFFCSFSAADLRWSEIIESIMMQQGIAVNADELSWDEKCKILRCNPVTAARMFDHRFHLFLKTVIMSDAHPIGKVKDYFYRVEFQQRGSPHTHCLFWIEDAPKFEEDEDQKVIDFVDKYITCSVPSVDVDPELHKIVNAVQQHSKHHSKSCKKKGTNCRFNFPRPPSVHSFISRPTTEKDLTESDIKVCKNKLETVWKEIKDSELDDLSTEKLFEKAGLSQKEFEKCFQHVTSRNTIVLKRKKTECFTNQYNAHLLRAWDANMDIQFVLDVFSCVVYIISYISKSERELGMLLQQTKCEAADGNLSAQQTMKKVGSAYLHHREISAQEAVFRVTGLRMKECSRKVEFIPVGDNPCRLSIPLQQLKKKVESKSRQQQHDGDEVENHSDENKLWMRNKNDIYKAKPDIDMFNEMCLADFCSKFNVLTESQVPKKINKDTTFKLKNDFGYIRKLTRTSSGIIRYPRFTVDKVPEKYYQSILQLFLPFKNEDQLKPSMFETYEDFYKRGHVKFLNSNSLLAVKDTVDHNMSSYVKTSSSIEEAIEKLEENGSHEDAWAQLCSESESERVMCGIEGSENGSVNDDEIIENNVPDLNREVEKEFNLPIRSTVFSNQEIIPMLRSMNENQKQIFFDIRHWCLEKANGKHVDPFYVFITGGAGTGKSRLIKCLYFEISRILAPTLCNPDDVSVLLTAPTGTAAFNINGMTIHSCLSIFKSLSKDHATLSEDKLNTLRSKLDNLQVLIIDEISMVNKRLLYFVHERLRQIKKKPETCLFGGVSIIAVGDFYQLPPVKSKKSDKLYVNDPSNPLNYLWNELFKVAVLREIMRQKDDKTFAEMLNRLRIKKKNEIIELDDFTLLKHCMKEAPDRILHIFATNAEVQQFNNSMIMKYFSDPVLLEAEDYEKDKTTGTLKRKSSFYNSSDIQLPPSILLAFDDDNVACVGKSAKEQKIISGNRCVGLVRCSEDLSFASGVRKQYPLKLAFACTAHKVQGLTVSEVAVDLSKCFTFGQSYVALSRVTSNKGLFISEMNNESLSAKIYADPDIEAGLASMQLFSMRTASAPVVNILKEHQMTIAYHNIQGLVPHISDLKVNSEMVRADFICLTETWLTSNDQYVKLDNYGFRHVCRNDVFNNDNEMFRTIKQMKNGGVGYFSKNGIDFEHINFDIRNIECIGFRIMETDTIVVTVYRTQKYNVKIFVKQLGLVLNQISSISDKSIIVGDFNQDILKEERYVESFMKSNGYVQIITEPTTEKGTLIDHVYVKGINSYCVRIVPTFYSYHEAIEINTGNV